MRACSVIIASMLAATLSHAADLKLIPTPQQVQALPGSFDFKGSVVTLAPKAPAEDNLALRQVVEEVVREMKPKGTGVETSRRALIIGEIALMAGELKGQDLSVLADKGPEAYFLLVSPDKVLVAGNSPAGTFYGVQTVKQLIRANRIGTTIPCCRILDWPGLKYRGYSDDISRGPIPTMDYFKREIRTMAEFKMNLLTFYTEHVFKLQKHPVIAPEDGLTAAQVKELSAYARQYHVELVGNFQSFGHFYQILKHPEYAHLRETGGIITPVKEESYQFLDDVYSEIAPAYDSPLFNVNCDETEGLGTGPSKDLAAQIGVGGVYVRHMIRIHDLLRDKYHKRMMMWGDIALQHPDIVRNLPKDTILLSWGYGARDTYDSAIEPFTKAGFEFMVCPGVSCWSQIFPNYRNALVNIQNYTRDGAKFGALGALNTTWDDDGENLFTWNFYGTNWGGACAWKPADSRIEDYDAAYAQVSYGTPDDKLTRAITLLAGCAQNPLTEHNSDRAFWVRPFGALATTFEAVTKQADKLCATTGEAIKLLGQAKVEASLDAGDMDYLIFAARRLQFIGRSRQLWLQACARTTEALLAFPDTKPTAAALQQAQAATDEMVKTVTELRTEYERLWLLENRPWWLKEMSGKYEALIRDATAQSQKIAAAREALAAGKMPDIAALGLKVLETGRRDTRALPTTEPILPADAKWWNDQWAYRLPVKLQFGAKAVTDYPVEVAVNFGEVKPEPASLRAVEVKPDGQMVVGPAQLIALPDGKTTVAFIAPGQSAAKSARVFALYYDAAGTAAKPPAEGPALTAKLEGGWATIDSGPARMIVGAQGGHVFEWFVKALGDLEITEPGRGGWAGFCDAGDLDRSAQFDLTLEAAGPVLARLKGSAKNGANERTLTFYAGQPLVEVMLAQPVGFYWDYDSIANFAADKGNPGTALFSDGFQEPVCKSDEQVHVVRGNVTWCAKTRADGLLLANLTPEVAARHMTGPGGGWGGVGIEGSAPVSHFVTFADKITGDPAAVLNAVQQTLDLRNQPQMWMGKVEKR